MKLLKIVCIAWLPLLASAQNDTIQELQNRIARLESQNNKLSKQVRQMSGELSAFKSSVQASVDSRVSVLEDNVASSISKVDASLEANKQELAKSLTTIEEKSAAQEAEISDIKETVDSKYQSLLKWFWAALILLPIIAIIASRMATRRALAQSQGNWNKFQEHILKK